MFIDVIGNLSLVELLLLEEEDLLLFKFLCLLPAHLLLFLRAVVSGVGTANALMDPSLSLHD